MPSETKPDPSPGEKNDSPRPLWGRYLLFGGIALVGLAADLLSKHYIFLWRGIRFEGVEYPNPADCADEPYWIIRGYFGLETTLNQGALFGLGQGQVWLFVILSIIAAIGIAVWVFRGGAAKDLLLTVALGCVMAGICGNLYDRLGLWSPPGSDVTIHAVRDWILWRYEDYTWPNFNIADSLLVCGVGLLLWHTFTTKDEHPPESSATA